MTYLKLEPGDPAYLADFPQMCICGSQKGRMVATGRPPLGTHGEGQIYLCRLCVSQAARALGMLRSDEMERLQNAADELAQAEREIADRQALLDTYTSRMGEQETKIRQQAGFIESLQGEISTFRSHADQLHALSGAMVAA